MENDKQNERLTRLETQFIGIAETLKRIEDNMITKIEFDQVIASFNRYKETTKQYFDEVVLAKVKELEKRVDSNSDKIASIQKYIYVAVGAVAILQVLIGFYR